jgi:nucleoside-diphosphate-sugar epimerase
MKPPFTRSHYALSKKEADLLVRSFADRLQVCLIHPTFMIGAYDAKPSSGAILIMGSKRVVWVPPGGKNFVNASDVASAVIAALDRGVSGRSYLVTGENLTYLEFFKKLSAVQAQNPIYIKMPGWMLRGLGKMGDVVRSMGVATSLSSANLESLCISNFYGSDRMRSELRIEPRPIEIGISEAVSWFRKEGKL